LKAIYTKDPVTFHNYHLTFTLAPGLLVVKYNDVLKNNDIVYANTRDIYVKINGKENYFQGLLAIDSHFPNNKNLTVTIKEGSNLLKLQYMDEQIGFQISN
jgi:hypothetical protein